MSLWNYAIFDLIVTTGNLRRAAGLMNLSASAVSHSLTKLEKEFGFPLLKRDRTGIELTEYGREILPHIRAVLAMDQKLHAEIERISGIIRGSVRIGVINSICSTWLPSIIRQMRREYPEVRVCIIQGGYDDMERGFVKVRLTWHLFPCRQSAIFRQSRCFGTGFSAQRQGILCRGIKNTSRLMKSGNRN